MLRIAALIVVFPLVGCDKLNSDSNNKERISVLEADVQSLTSDVNALKGDVKSLQRTDELTYNALEAAHKSHESLRNTFNKNVEIDNKRQDALDTSLGRCGKEWVQSDQGYVTVNRDCSKVAPKK